MKLMRICVVVLLLNCVLLLAGSALAENFEINAGDRKTINFEKQTVVEYSITGIAASSVKILATVAQACGGPNLIHVTNLSVDKDETKTKTEYRTLSITFIVESGKVKLSVSANNS